MAEWENRDILRLAGNEERRRAAREITNLAESRASFSFLRLGDGELRFLLDAQAGAFRDLPDTRIRSIERAFCHPGLKPVDASKLLRSYEHCLYLDYHDHLAYNRENLGALSLERVHEFRNASPGTAGILAEWTGFELPEYTSRHRCLFCGAEADLLGALMADPVYLRHAGAHWPAPENCMFLQPAGNGVDLSGNMTLIKAQLKAAIDTYNIHTIFLSLGGAAKILAVELAEERKVRAFDFGSMMRALAYAGSAGNAECRASHGYFFFHVPFATYMDALGMSPKGGDAWLLNKAHAQLVWELQEKHPIASTPSELSAPETFSKEAGNLSRFEEGLAEYFRRYRSLGKRDAECRFLVREFDRWCGVHGIGFRGKMFRVRGMLQRLLAWKH